MTKCCEACGTILVRKIGSTGRVESPAHLLARKYCDVACFKSAAFIRSSAKSDYSTTHRVARLLVPNGTCNKCGNTAAKDVHHIDGNHRNNNPQNLTRLCRSCHMKEHRKHGKCRICGDKTKGLGLCNKHYLKFKRGTLNVAI